MPGLSDRSPVRGLARWLPAAGALALACTLAGALTGPRAGAQSPAATPPNFIIVMADDLGPGMERALPSVERLLGRRGVSFENAIASYPLCCPARATMLTGQYAHNHGAKGNSPRSGGGYGALREPERNLAAWLQASDYETAFAGKWLNGLRTPRRAPPGWDRWWGLVGSGGEGLSSFYDYDVFEIGAEPRHFGAADSDYQTDALTREYALPFIAGQAVDPRPFFLWLAYHPPHNGLGRDDSAGRRCSEGPPDSRSGTQSAIPAERHARRFMRARLPRRPSFDEADVADKPAFVRRRPRLDEADVDQIERDHRCGMAALLALDEAVGDIVDGLRASDQLDNTVVIFTSDHGVLAGEHRITRGKNEAYEEAIGIPLVLRGPGIARRGELSEPVVNADLAPTILDLAGAEVPVELERPIDGRSLVPQLAGHTGADDPDRALLIEGRDNVARARRGFKVRSYVGVRTSRYVLVEQRRAAYSSAADGIDAPIGAGRTTGRELYDLRRDPYQLVNRDRDPAYAGARNVLRGLLARLELCSGTECSVTADVPAPAARPSRG